MSSRIIDDLGAQAPRAAEFGGDALVVCDNLVRIHWSGAVEVQALQGLELLVSAGEMIQASSPSASRY